MIHVDSNLLIHMAYGLRYLSSTNSIVAALSLQPIGIISRIRPLETAAWCCCNMHTANEEFIVFFNAF